jgi:CheY-like chemotaxis protein
MPSSAIDLAKKRQGADSDRPVARLLLVEDDADIVEPLARALAREGHELDVAGDGHRALQAAASPADHNLVILDVGLPGLDGLEVCRRLRAGSPWLPVPNSRAATANSTLSPASTSEPTTT